MSLTRDIEIHIYDFNQLIIDPKLDRNVHGVLLKGITETLNVQ